MFEKWFIGILAAAAVAMVGVNSYFNLEKKRIEAGMLKYKAEQGIKLKFGTTRDKE